jgi:single-strand DNA-binding protein
MAYFNKVTMIGNLTRDPEVKQSPTGLALCSFGVASNRSFKNKQNGELEKDVCFIDVNFWGNNAEYYGQCLKKGQEVLLEGRLKFNTWQDQGGAKHAKHLIIADRIIPMYPNPDQKPLNTETKQHPTISQSVQRGAQSIGDIITSRLPNHINSSRQEDSAEMDGLPF